MNISLNRAMALTALALALFAAFRSQAIWTQTQQQTQRTQLIENEDVKVWRSLSFPTRLSPCTATNIRVSSSPSPAAP